MLGIFSSYTFPVLRIHSVFRHFPWVVLLKALAIAASWVVFPSWMFVAVTIGFYFIPIFQPLSLLWPLILALAFAVAIGFGLPQTVFVVAIFFLILGIKDLVFIDRRAAYQTLVLLMLFAAALILFFGAPNASRLSSAWGALAFGVLAWILISEFLPYAMPVVSHSTLPMTSQDESSVMSESVPGVEAPAEAPSEPIVAAPAGSSVGLPPEVSREGGAKEGRVAASLGGFILWQISWALILVPMNAFSRTALLFLATAVFLDLFAGWAANNLTRRLVLTNATIFLVFFVIILTANQWGV